MWRALSGSDDTNDETDEDETSGTSGNITSTSYTIQELESGTVYSFRVTVTNAAGSTTSEPIIITSTITAVIYMHVWLTVVCILNLKHFC